MASFGNILKWLSPAYAAGSTKAGRDFLFGGEDQLNKVSTLTPEQEQLHKGILGQAMGMQGQGGGY